MLSVETILTFFTASVLLALAPGPDNIFVLTQSALRGKRSGLMVMLGLCSGLLVHTTAVALGIAVIFHSSQLAFTLLKSVGALYLVYLAWQAFRAHLQKPKSIAKVDIGYKKLYFRGIIMNITNPKVSIFFLAFLPQFANANNGSLMLQLFLLGGVFILATLLVFSTIALLAGSFGDAFSKSQRAQNILNKLAGTVFLGLAIKLAVTER